MYNLSGTIEERTSKNGNKYKVLCLHITDSYSKDVFLSDAEIEIFSYLD